MESYFFSEYSHKGGFVVRIVRSLGGEWLSDAVINCAQDLLKTSYPDTGGLQKTTLAFTLSYAVVQIMNTRDNHWITVSNIGCPVDHINVYDSMPYCSTSKRTKEEICSILFSSAEEITLDFPCDRKQKGGSDCGLFSIAYATTLCSGLNPKDVISVDDRIHIKPKT